PGALDERRAQRPVGSSCRRLMPRLLWWSGGALRRAAQRSTCAAPLPARPWTSEEFLPRNRRIHGDDLLRRIGEGPRESTKMLPARAPSLDRFALAAAGINVAVAIEGDARQFVEMVRVVDEDVGLEVAGGKLRDLIGEEALVAGAADIERAVFEAERHWL